MRTYIALIVVSTSLGFCYGVRPALEIDAGGYVAFLFSGGDSESYNIVGVGVTVPFSRHIGLAGNVSKLISDYGSHLGVSVGLIEMIPGKTISPFFKQQISFLGGEPFSLRVNFGAEFLSSSNVSPLMGVGLAFLEMGNISFGIDVGVRFSWVK